MQTNFIGVCVLQDLVALVVGSLEREGVRMLRECEPREVRRENEGGEEGRRLEVIWHDKGTGDTEKVRNYTTLL